MIDPIQPQSPTAPVSSLGDVSAASLTPATSISATSAVSTAAFALSSAAAAPVGKPSAQPAATPAANAAGARDTSSESASTPPLRLLIEHDQATNHYVYKLYDSSGRIVREIPQESLADAQKQAAGVPGSLFDTTV
jgi:hypothetical protein